MTSNSFSDMLESPYHPDHIFGDEETWYDAPLGLAEPEIEEYFDALEKQDVLDEFSVTVFLTSTKENKYVCNPERGHYPIIPAITLQQQIAAFVAAGHFFNDDPLYIQLNHLGNKLINLHEDHENHIKLQDRMIEAFVANLSVVKQTLYEVDNVYSGSDCKRKRDLNVEKINACVGTKKRLEQEYIDTISLLTNQAEEIRTKWLKQRDEEQQHARQLETQNRLNTALRELETFRWAGDGLLGLSNERTQLLWQMDRIDSERERYRRRAGKLVYHLRAHRDAIIFQRRRRDEAQLGFERDLSEERARVVELQDEVNDGERLIQQQASWINELEMHGVRGEVFNRQNGTWEVPGATHKRRFDEYQGEAEIEEERCIKRERLD
ncbi:hypothetical protein NHQ30_004449 [Ciborinia camelliae]|nr:hypothetical protein NHQ30_004449 [Ciborinia camelliae]